MQSPAGQNENEDHEDERTHLLPISGREEQALPTTTTTTTTGSPISDVDPANTIPASLTRRLYVSHFLSTWNSRFFEFGAILFLASIFPGTLMPLSIYALARSAAAILFAHSVGSWIDHGNRLVVVRVSIVGQRAAVATSCGIFWILDQDVAALGPRMRNGLFAVTVVLACVEKICSMMNLVSVERDWVVAVTEGNEHARRGCSSCSLDIRTSADFSLG